MASLLEAKRLDWANQNLEKGDLLSLLGMLLILEIVQNLTTLENKKEIINRHQKKLCMIF